MARDCIYIIDTFSLMFQVFHAIPSMTGTRGQPTNAVFGFTRDIFAILDRKPAYLVCALDSPGPGKRDEIFDRYKSNRTEIPEDLRPQIPLIKQLLEGFRIPGIECPEWEADDVIATMTRQAVEQGLDVVIVSTDKDARQLLGPHVRMLNCRKNEFYNEASLMEDWGVRPDQVVDFQSLVGDSVDNVPGVPKIGPKTAKTLIEQFGTLENILANASKAPGKKVQENLTEFAAQAFMSRELVRLRQDLPITLDMDAARVCDPDYATLLTFFNDMGFRRYAAQMREHTGAAPSGNSLSGTSTAAESSDGSGNAASAVAESPSGIFSGERPTAASRDASTDSVIPITDSVQLTELLATLKDSTQLAVEPILSGTTVTDRRVSGVVLSDDQKVFVIDLARAADAELTSTFLNWLAAFSGDVLISTAKSFCHALLNSGYALPQRFFDLSIADYLLDAGARGHELSDIAERYGSSAGADTAIATVSASKARQKTMFDDEADDNSPAIALKYALATRAVRQVLSLASKLRNALETDNLNSLYRDLEEPLIHVLAKMEHVGIRVDMEELKRQSIAAGTVIDRLTAEIFQSAGKTFNIDSPKQLSVILFTDLQLPVLKKTQTGASTDQEVLEELASLHPLPRLILERRHLIKLRGTYLDALPALVSPATGRIHATFHQTVAATGRLSSSDPNLQNIPIRTPEGRKVRAAFRSGEPDWMLVCADYSQIELRVLAHFSGDAAMCDAFQSGQDIHAAVASEVFSVPLESVTSDQRRIAKAVNFGVIYGQTPWGLAAALGIDKGAAAIFIDHYFQKYSGVATFCEHVLKETVRTGFARTILNRRREISGIRRTTGINRNMPERTAINTVLQGTAADLIKKAMLDVDAMLKATGIKARLLLQIHDELVLECPEAKTALLIPKLRDCMQHAMTLNVPLDVDVTIGTDWLNQTDVPNTT